MKRFSLILFGLGCFCFLSKGQTITHAEYFFDTDPGVLNGTAVSGFTGGDLVDEDIAVDVTGLDPGFHWLYVRVFYGDNTVSISQGRRFYVYPTVSSPTPSANLARLEYYFDTDPGAGNGTSVDYSDAGGIDHDFDVDVTGLDPGFHYLYVRVQDADNQWSHTQFSRFYIFSVPPSPVASADILEIEYFFDSDPGPGNGDQISFTSSGGQVEETLSIPIGGLETGFHQLGVRVLDADGKWSLAHQRKFYVFEVHPAPPLSTSIEKVEYFFGVDPGVGNGLIAATDLTADQIDQDFIIDVDGLAPGDHLLSIRVIDADGRSSIIQTDQITVLDNNLPDFTNLELSIDENPLNGASVGSIAATDLDGNDLTFSFVEPSAVYSIDGGTGEVTVLDSTYLDHEAISQDTVLVEVEDTNGGVRQDTLFVNINDVNEAPMIEPQNFEIQENSLNGTVVGSVSASDPEDDALTFSITLGNDLGIFAIGSGTGEISILDSTALDFETLTSVDLTVQIGDAEFSDEALVTIVLTDVFENRAPVVENPLPDLDFLNGFTSSTVNLMNVFSDADGHVLNFNISSSDESVVTLSLSGVTLTLSEVGSGSSTISVSANDGNGGITTDEFTVLVNVPNSPPVLSLIADATATEGFAMSIGFSATDTDLPAQALTFSLDAISLAKGMVLNESSGAFSWTPTQEQTGVHNVTVTVSDGLEEDRQTFEIFVEEVNEAPILRSIDDQSVLQDTELSFTAIATDADVPVQQLTYFIDAISRNKGMELDSTSGAFRWTPTAAHVRVHDVTISVTDGALEHGQSFTIEVIRGNTAPEIRTALPNVTLIEGFESEDINLNNVFQDAEGDFISFSAESADQGIATVSVTGTVLTLVEVAIGLTVITVTATDAIGASANIMFNLTIEEAPLSISELADTGMSLFPNPTDESFVISGLQGAFLKLTLYSLDGKVSKVFDSFQEEFDVSTLNAGLYTVILETDQDRLVSKLRVE